MEHTVTSKIIEDMYQNPKGLTVDECKERYGTHELRSIVAHAAKKGFVFEKKWETGENRYGHPTKWYRYFLVDIVRE